MKKHLFTLLLALLAGLTASAHDFEVDGIYYNKNGTEATVTNKDSTNNSYSGDVAIPASVTYEGTTYQVTAIGDWAFAASYDLKSITIPDSVTSIGNAAFANCYGLTSVTIPDSVTMIDVGAFQNCENLASVSLGNSVTSIGEDAFYGCSSLTSVTIPDSVTVINSYAFFGCSGLASVSLGNSVTSIGNFAFMRCTGLASVTIPESVKAIGKGAFAGCTSLAEFRGKYASDDHRCLIVDGMLNSFAPAGLTSYSIPDSATSIGIQAFDNCTELSSVTIPNTVTSIGDAAFSSCSNLSEFNGKLASDDHRCLIVDGTMRAFAPAGLTAYSIPNSVASIGDYAFWECSSLVSVTIPESVTSIGNWAFEYCSNLASVTIPDSVTSIGRYAFYDTALYNDDSNWDNNVLYIGNQLIQAKSDITGACTIRSGTRSIAGAAFEYCSGLTSVTIPNSVTLIGNYAFNYCSGLTSVTIPDSVTSIGYAAFAHCSGMTTVNFGNSLASIEGAAFFGCEKLTSVTLPNSLISIGAQAFQSCSGLVSATIPESVTSIGRQAFDGCSSMASVAIPESVTRIGFWAFRDTALYNDESNWENDVLYIGKFLIQAKEDLAGAYAIKDQTLVVADYAFEQCADLTSVTFPQTISAISDCLFYMCSALASVDIPGSVTSIGLGALAGCSALTSVTIPESVSSIGHSAFEGCSSLASVTVQNDNPGNIAMGEYVFYGVPTDTCILYVPEGSSGLYAAADQWKAFLNIEEYRAGLETVVAGQPGQAADADAPYYDLSGRRVANPVHGLYIRNGRKVLVK